MIAEIEEGIIAAIKTALGTTVRYVESHPGNWDPETVSSIVISAPSVYVAWLGAKPTTRTGVINNEWVVFVVAETLNGQRDEPVGVYQITERIMALFETQAAGVGTMTFDRAKNLFTDTSSAQGCALYGLYFLNAAQINPYTPSPDGGGLDDFLRHYQTFEQQHDGAPVMAAHINLPGTGENNEDR